MEVVMILAIGFVCMACFLVGAKVGQAVAKGEKVETPTLNPVKAIREHQEKKEAEFAQNKFDAIMENIDNYDGTGYGQKDVPRG
jgi:hypothetical protein